MPQERATRSAFVAAARARSSDRRTHFASNSDSKGVDVERKPSPVLVDASAAPPSTPPSVEPADPESVPAVIAADRLCRAKYDREVLLPAWTRTVLHSGVDPDHLGDDGVERLFRRYRDAQIPDELLALVRHPRDKQWEPELQLVQNLRAVAEAVRLKKVPSLLARGGNPRFALVSRDDFALVAKQLPRAGPWPERHTFSANERGEALWLPHLTKLMNIVKQTAWHFHECCTLQGKPWAINHDVAAWTLAEFPDVKEVSKHFSDFVAMLVRPSNIGKGKRVT